MAEDYGYSAADESGEGGYGEGEFPAESDDTESGETYWAKKPRDDLREELVRRQDEYFQGLNRSAFADAINRNWLYYHGLFGVGDDFNIFGTAIQRVGMKGERSFMGVNHFRNLIQHLFVIATRDRPAPKSRAINPDYESLMDAMTVDGVLEQYMREGGFSEILARAVEHSLVLTKGYVALDWDETLGEAVDGDVKTNRLQHQGDVSGENPTLIDVVLDADNMKPFRKHSWVCTRDWPNKWDLIACYPKMKEKILNSKEPFDSNFRLEDRPDRRDVVGRWTFWHHRTPGMPTGRKMCFTRACCLNDGPLPDYLERPPVFQCMPSEVLLTNDGWSPGFDLQGPQEAINMMISNIVTTHDAFGIQNIWSPLGNNLSIGQIAGGLRFIQSKYEPKPLQLAKVASDATQFIELVIKWMETLSGINSVTRGQPEYTLKSGKALSIVEAKAIQFASRMLASVNQLTEDVLTSLVQILSAKMGSSPRVAYIAGKYSRMIRRDYTADTLKSVKRVYVEVGNPLLRTLSGRVDMAEMFIKNGWVKLPEEVMGLFDTGRMEPMLQADQAQLALLASERDALMEGDIVPVLKTDYHSLHIRECVALLNTPAIRMDDVLAANVLSHSLVHIAMLYLPDVRDLQIAQGYQVPPLSPMIPPGLLDQISPEYQESFSPTDRLFFQTPLNSMGPGPGGALAGPGAPGGPSPIPMGPQSANVPEAPPEGAPSPLETEAA